MSTQDEVEWFQFRQSGIPAGRTGTCVLEIDPELEALIDAAQATTDLEEYTRLSKEADMRLTELHWYLWSPRTVHYLVHQPWIVGFNGELSLGANDVGPVIYARLWIDEQLRGQYVN